MCWCKDLNLTKLEFPYHASEDLNFDWLSVQFDTTFLGLVHLLTVYYIYLCIYVCLMYWMPRGNLGWLYGRRPFFLREGERLRKGWLNHEQCTWVTILFLFFPTSLVTTVGTGSSGYVTCPCSFWHTHIVMLSGIVTVHICTFRTLPPASPIPWVALLVLPQAAWWVELPKLN